MTEQLKREAFADFIARHPEFQPASGEEMLSVHRKQRNAFIAYVDSEVSSRVDMLIEKLSQLDAALARANSDE